MIRLERPTNGFLCLNIIYHLLINSRYSYDGQSIPFFTAVEAYQFLIIAANTQSEFGSHL